MLLAALSLVTASDLGAQPGGSLAQKTVGTWAVASQYVEQDGKRLQPFGDKPKGRVMFDDKGRFMLIGLRSDLPKFASNNRMTGTPDESTRRSDRGRSLLRNVATIDDKEGTITQRYGGQHLSQLER
jgi:hypothetical protein